MTKHFSGYLAPLASVVLLVGCSAKTADNQAEVVANSEAPPNLSIPASELQFTATAVFAPNGDGPLLAAPAFGDMAKGAHSTFIRMPSGFSGAVHTHTHDFRVAVISGVGVNVAVGGKDIPLPPGSYWFQPGGKKHVTKCISETDCLFYATQSEAFDYNVVTP